MKTTLEVTPNVLNIITGNGINLHCCCLNVLVNKHNTLRQFLFLQPQFPLSNEFFWSLKIFSGSIQISRRGDHCRVVGGEFLRR